MHRAPNPTKKGESAPGCLAARIILSGDDIIPRSLQQQFDLAFVFECRLCTFPMSNTVHRCLYQAIGSILVSAALQRGSGKPGALSTTNASLVEIRGTISGVSFLLLR